MGLLERLPEEFQQTTLLFPTILVVFLLSYLCADIHRKRKLPPGPAKLPIIGNLHQLGNLPHLSLHSLAKKYGPIIYLELGQIPTVVISTAKMAREVMRTYDLALSSRPKLFAAKYIFYNGTDIVFSPYGAYWRHIRKICILELLSSKRVQAFRPVREEEVARMVQRIEESSCTGTVNMSKILGLYANDVLCRATFGRDFSGEGDYDSLGFQEMLQEYQELVAGFSLGDFFPALEEFVHRITGMTKRLEDTSRRFDELFDRILREHENCQKNGSMKDDQKDLVDVLLEIQKDSSSAEMPLTTDNVKAVIMDMFAAGTDTSFITLDWAMTELILNSEAMEAAQNEVRSIVGERKFVLETDIPQMPYLKAVIKEVFRLHPPAPVLVPRESMEEIAVGDYRIPAKTRFFINAWSIGRDTEAWENPEEFKPERFLDNPIDYKGQDFELIPFGIGRRICPAMTFGAATVELALAQLLHSFDWYLPPGIKPEDLDMKEIFGITMHRVDDLILVAKPHSS